MSIARSYTSEKSQNIYDDVASLTSSKYPSPYPESTASKVYSATKR